MTDIKRDHSEKFVAWLKICMRENSINSYSELASKIGVTRQSLHAWIKDPTKIKRCILAGMVYLLNAKNTPFETLCNMFGIR